jgi:hypothetical protein
VTRMITTSENYNNIRAGIVELLTAARSAAARNVNSIMTAVYWKIGQRIVKLEQGGQYRTEYGEQLVEQLSGDLTRQFVRDSGRANLGKCMHFTVHCRRQRFSKRSLKNPQTPLFSVI